MKRKEYSELLRNGGEYNKKRITDVLRATNIGQGYGYKSTIPWIKMDLDDIIYCPEYAYKDRTFLRGWMEYPLEVYTKEDFIKIFNGNECGAKILFESVDWQYPETLFNEEIDMDEIQYCPKCDKFYYHYEGKKCNVCGVKYEKYERWIKNV